MNKINMKNKLWIAWVVFACLSIISLLCGHRVMAYVFAFSSAGFGWINFFAYY
jgi:hypothetical protein